jgi:hypothetical protein
MKIKIRSTVELNLSADDWSLYGMKGREEIAKKLNRELEERINKATSRSEFEYGNLLSQYSDYGASDSEGFQMVEHVLNKVFDRSEAVS